MPHKMENEKIKDWGANYQEAPKDHVWNRIDQRLDRQLPKQSIIKRLNWKHYTIAANLVIILAVVALMTPYFSGKSNAAFAFNINQKPLKMEDVANDAPATPYFSVQQSLELADAYRNFKSY